MAGTLVANTINTDTGVFTTNNAYLGIAKAWVNFNGTTASPSTIRSSFNVSSITKNGTGDYTVNFSTAMADANYCSIAGNGSGAANTVGATSYYGQAPTTTTVRIATYNGVFSLTDYAYVSCAILGN